MIDARLATRPARAAAWSVHLLTASGALWGLLALDAAAAGRGRAAVGWLLVALAVDSCDGTLARRIRVGEVLPEIDGGLLDNVIDYLNYVAVPALLVARGGFLPERVALVAAAAMCVASAFQFAHVEAKSTAHFRGFPSYWNIVAAYLLLLDMPAPWAALAIAALVVLTLTPIRFLYPSRAVALRRTTLVAGGAWFLALALALWLHPRARALAVVSLLYPAAYLAAGVGAAGARLRIRKAPTR